MGTNYHVYFVGSGEITAIDPKMLKPELIPSRRRRQDYLNLEFYFDGVDDLECVRWKVGRIQGGCVCSSQTVVNRPPPATSCDNFHIAYVIGEVRAEEEYVRERGGPFLSGRW